MIIGNLLEAIAALNAEQRKLLADKLNEASIADIKAGADKRSIPCEGFNRISVLRHSGERQIFRIGDEKRCRTTRIGIRRWQVSHCGGERSVIGLRQ